MCCVQLFPVSQGKQETNRHLLRNDASGPHAAGQPLSLPADNAVPYISNWDEVDIRAVYNLWVLACSHAVWLLPVSSLSTHREYECNLCALRWFWPAGCFTALETLTPIPNCNTILFLHLALSLTWDSKCTKVGATRVIWSICGQTYISLLFDT